MKVFLSADIEGVTGITDWDEADHEKAAYSEFRERMNAEVVAACEGALEGGATEILVNDSHYSGRNLFAERLPREAKLLRGWSGHPYCMVQGLDRSFDAAMFVGWHSAGSRGGNPLAHTLSSTRLVGIRVNGAWVSEFHLHAWTASLERVPVVFVSGDEDLCAAVREVDERIRTAAVSRGEGASTISIHPEEARGLIRAGARAAVEAAQEIAPVGLPERFALEVRYKDQRTAYRASFYPGASLETPTAVTLETADWFEVMRALQFLSA